jgi:hypothetical protein
MCLLVALGMFLVLQAPAAAIEEIHAGVKGGVNIANQSVDPSDSEYSDYRSGMAIGGYIGIPLAPGWSIQPEALFSMKGDKEEASGVSGSAKLDYIEVPVLAKASFMPHASAHPSLFAGPSVAYNLSSKTAIEGMGAPLDGEYDMKDETSAFDFGLVFGGGLEIPMSSGVRTVGIDVRYTLGLTNTIDQDTGVEAKNHVLSIMGSIGFL